MKKEFDFDKVGKRTPYRIPEGFFNDMQNNVMQHTVNKKRKFSLIKSITVSLSAAAVILGMMIVSSNIESDEDEMRNEDLYMASTNWIENMSEEDLAYMESIYECDIFMY